MCWICGSTKFKLYADRLCYIFTGCSTNLFLVCIVLYSSCVHLLFDSRRSMYNFNTKCWRVTQNRFQLTRRCRGRAWTAKKPGCPLTLVVDWSASYLRRTVTQCCPLASTAMDTANSMWTTLKCPPRLRTRTRLSGKTQDRCYRWGMCWDGQWY